MTAIRYLPHDTRGYQVQQDMDNESGTLQSLQLAFEQRIMTFPVLYNRFLNAVYIRINNIYRSSFMGFKMWPDLLPMTC